MAEPHKVARTSWNTLKIEVARAHLSAVLYSNSGMVPLSSRPYQLTLEGHPPLAGETDAEGYLEHPDVAVGDYRLDVDGVRGWVPTVPQRDERLPVRVAGYFVAPRGRRAPRAGADSEGGPETSDEWQDVDPADLLE